MGPAYSTKWEGLLVLSPTPPRAPQRTQRFLCFRSLHLPGGGREKRFDSESPTPGFYVKKPMAARGRQRGRNRLGLASSQWPPSLCRRGEGLGPPLSSENPPIGCEFSLPRFSLDSSTALHNSIQSQSVVA